MGGRGTFAVGNKVPYSYETVGTIDGVKVLQGTSGKHGLPEEAHSSVGSSTDFDAIISSNLKFFAISSGRYLLQIIPDAIIAGG